MSDQPQYRNAPPEIRQPAILEDPFHRGEYITGLGLDVDVLLRYSPEAKTLLKQARDQGYTIGWGQGSNTDRVGRRIIIDESFRGTPERAADAVCHELGLAIRDPEYSAAPARGDVSRQVERNVGIDLRLQGHAELERMKAASEIRQNLGKYAQSDSPYFRRMAEHAMRMGTNPEIAPADAKKLASFENGIAEKIKSGKLTEQQAESEIGTFMGGLHPAGGATHAADPKWPRAQSHGERRHVGHPAGAHHGRQTHHGRREHHPGRHGQDHRHESFWQRLFHGHEGTMNEPHGTSHQHPNEHRRAAEHGHRGGRHESGQGHPAPHGHHHSSHRHHADGHVADPRHSASHVRAASHAHSHGSLPAAGPPATYSQIYTAEWRNRFFDASDAPNRFGALIDPHKLMGEPRTTAHAPARHQEAEREIDR